MRFVPTLLIILSTFCVLPLFSQNADTNKAVTPDTTKALKDTSSFNYFFNQEEETKFLEYKPIISLGTGVLSFYGEAMNKPRSHPVIGRMGVNLGVSKNVNEYFSLGLSAVMGKLSGNYRSSEKNFNFQTDIFTGGVCLTYNFGHLLKKEGYLTALSKQYEVLPFVSIGLEAVSFNSKGDMKDKNGNTYYYWSDGTIRNMAENSPNAANSILLQRDYKYETDLRDMNLDGFGRYSQTTLGIPLCIGADFIVHERVTLRLSSSIHYTFSDNIDNISSKSIGIRKGGKPGDAYMYTNITFLFDIFSKEKILDYDKFQANNPNMSDFDKIYFADEDKDGVNDFDDNCIGTQLGVAVDKKGCPVDCDGDGIPDYLDKEYNTPLGTVVDLNGNPYTEEMMMELAKDTAKTGIDYDQVEKYYPSLASGAKRFESFADEIPAKFKYADANEDGFLSLEEFYNEVDRFFDGKSKLSLEEIYDLMEFFFMQE